MTTMCYGLFTFKNLLAMLYVPYTGDITNIVLSSCTVLTGSLVLIFFGERSELVLWIGVAVVAIGDGGLCASSFRFMEEYFVVTTRISSLVILALVSGEFTLPALVSLVIEDRPQLLMVITFSCSLTMLVVFILNVMLCRSVFGSKDTSTRRE